MGKVRPIERTQPIHFVRGDAPPLWLASGDEDAVVRPRNSQNLAAAIEKAGGAAILRIYPGMGHTGTVMAVAAPFRGKGQIGRAQRRTPVTKALLACRLLVPNQKPRLLAQQYVAL